MNYQKNTIKFRKKIENNLKKEFDIEPVYHGKYLTAEIKPYNRNTNTGFHNNKIPKEGS